MTRWPFHWWCCHHNSNSTENLYCCNSITDHHIITILHMSRQHSSLPHVKKSMDRFVSINIGKIPKGSFILWRNNDCEMDPWCHLGLIFIGYHTPGNGVRGLYRNIIGSLDLNADVTSHFGSRIKPTTDELILRRTGSIIHAVVVEVSSSSLP